MYKVVKVWDISSGKNVFEFCADMGKEVGIRAMDVDRAGKRYQCVVQGVLDVYAWHMHLMRHGQYGNRCFHLSYSDCSKWLP